MIATRHLALALFRLLLLYGIFCFLILAVGLEMRGLKEEGWGLNPASSSSIDTTPQPPFLGINVELLQSDPTTRRAALNRLRAVGFGWARQRFAWGQIEPQPGQFDWTRSDAILHDLHAAGLQPVVVLDGSPAWARSPQDIGNNDNPFAPPADPASFAHFAAAFAQRYREQVTFYQIWDEPNIAPHWGNRHIEPVAYAQLLKATASAIRRADPTAVILTAALAPTRDRGHTAIDELYFLQRLYAAGAADAFDAVAVQPFGFGNAPNDRREQLAVLNFQRIKLVRRVMLAAGDGATPIWAVRFGWNSRPNAVWGTVSAATQRDFAVKALNFGYQRWPWLAAMGWMIDQSAQPIDDPMWGFALTPALEKEIRDWIGSSPPRDSSLPHLGRVRAGLPLLLLAITILASFWRFWAAASLLPWSTWVARYRAWPVWSRFILWAGLLFLYYFTTWPPLIVFCWLLAATLMAAQPSSGLWLAALLLPLHDQHKEIQLVDSIWTIAPTQAALICLLPGCIGRIFHAVAPSARSEHPQMRTVPRRCSHLRMLTPHSFDWLALAWLGLNLASNVNVWHWPGYWQGLTELTLVPLLLYGSVRTLINTEDQWHKLALTLGSGGLGVALFGLLAWSQGKGVEVDGVLRLAGPYYSPNQAALYLERTLWLGVGLALAATAWRRWGWWVSIIVMMGALLLTASRGAWLLALPTGLALWCWQQLPTPSTPVRVRKRIKQHVVTLKGSVSVLENRSFQGVNRAVMNLWDLRRIWIPGKGLIVLAAASLLAAGMSLFLFGERLTNSTTILSRFQIWRTTLDLWQAYPWLGVGPGGFFWRYPAYLMQPSAEPNLYHPHNLWLEFAANWGVAGLIWLAVFLQGLMKLCTVAQRNPISLGLLVGLVAGLAHAQVDTFAALPDLAGWNWLTLALLVQIERVMPQRHDPDQTM